MASRHPVAWTRTRVHVSLRQSATYARANMVSFAVIEIIGQPLFYYVWSEVYPQAYENAWLRSACVLLALPMLFEPQISKKWNIDQWIPAYWLFNLLFQLPFFFFLMALMNNLSVVWDLSALVALMLLVILTYDWVLTLPLALAGMLMAGAAFVALGGDFPIDGEIPLPALLCIYLFGLLVGTAVNYKAEVITQEKLAAVTDVLGTVAHELRTPLLGIRSGQGGLSKRLSTLIEGYEMAQAHGLPVQPIRAAHLRQMQSVLDRINAESGYATAMLEMLLVSSNRAAIDQTVFAPVQIADCIEAALHRYPFQSSLERENIHWDAGPDFSFLGSQVLMVHVLFNLLKNAIYHISRADSGEIFVWTTTSGSKGNQLHFRDTGPGIPADKLPKIFERFYSGHREGQGTGIGLAFVRDVIVSFGGHVHCDSQLGEFTEFTIKIPRIDRDAAV